MIVFRFSDGKVTLIFHTDFELFLPTGEELEKNLSLHSRRNIILDVDLDKMTLIGGHYKPVSSATNHAVAIIVPYRNRRINLERFLHSIHPFLRKQNVEYSIYVVEMVRSKLSFSVLVFHFFPTWLSGGVFDT